MRITDENDVVDALVIGGGPAGLMAAEVLSRAGRAVVVAEAKPTLGRKFLMAGKSGLNLTKAEDPGPFRRAYGSSAPWLAPMLDAFGPDQVAQWAAGLGQPLFTGSSGRVFPVAMKASPLLRAWRDRLAAADVGVFTRHRWTGWDAGGARFETPDGGRVLHPAVTVLALGGASWARLGSDGAWAGPVAAGGVPVTPFQPSNAGLRVHWAPQMRARFGAAVKGVALRSSGGLHTRGEFVISSRGLEGSGIYTLTPAVRGGEDIVLDLCPDLSLRSVTDRLARPRGKRTQSAHLRRTLGLDPARLALLHEFGRPLPADPASLAARVKSLPVRHAGLRPIDEAISTVGGVNPTGVTGQLMLKARPGVFVCGEMLDWDAPTGGYLLTACLATGAWAGRHAACWEG